MDLINVSAYFKENHLKITPQRLAIGKYLFNAKTHPTAEELFAKVVEEQPSISLATVYKTLNVFKQKGLIRELEISNSGSRFEPNLVPHINIVCPSCSKITDLHSPHIKEFIVSIEKEIGGSSIYQRIDFYQYCKECRKL